MMNNRFQLGRNQLDLHLCPCGTRYPKCAAVVESIAEKIP